MNMYFKWYYTIALLGLSLPSPSQPSLASLICYKCSVYFYHNTFQAVQINSNHQSEMTYMPYTKQCLLLFLALIILHILTSKLPIGAVTLLSTPPYWLSKHRKITTLTRVDWRTLCFFIGMFIFIPQASKVISSTLLHGWVTSSHGIFAISITLSQLLSNVPTAILLAPLIENLHHTPIALLALATSSTLAGNFLIIGAASNIILFQALRLKGYNLYEIISLLIPGMTITLPSALIYLG